MDYEFSSRAKKFLELFFAGKGIQESVIAAGYNCSSKSAMHNTAKKILNKYRARREIGIRRAKMELKTEEIVTAIELLTEQNQGQFTIPQLTQFFLPDFTTGANQTKEYSRNFRVVTALHKRGDLVRHDPLPGTYTPIFSISSGGINRETLASVCPAMADKSTKAKERSVPPKPETTELAGQGPRVIPRMDEIYEALVEEFNKSPEGVAIYAFRSHFPNSNQEDLRLRLNVMESEGMAKSTKIGIAKFYQPIQVDRPIPLPTAKAIRIKEAKRVRLFLCEVCPAVAIPASARSAIYTIPCNSCQSIYLIDRDEAYRLGPGIKIKTWIPDSGNGQG